MISASSDINITKFDSNLGITKVGTAELDKDRFIAAVQKNIQLFSLHTCFHTPGPDRTMLKLCDKYYDFTIDEMVKKYRDGAAKITIILDSYDIAPYFS